MIYFSYMKISILKITFFIFVAIFFATIGGGILPVYAIDAPSVRDSRYEAQFVRQSVPDPIKLVAGATTTVTVVFKNTGTASWNAAGSGRVTVFTIEPKYHESELADVSWINAYTPARLKTTTEPGDEGSFTFTLRAPREPGSYREHFYLAAENQSWVNKGYFYLDIEVSAAAQKAVLLSPSPVTSVPVATTDEIPTDTPLNQIMPATTTVELEPRSLIIEPLVRVGLLRTTSSVPVQLLFPYQIFAGSEYQAFVPANTMGTLSYQDGYHIAQFGDTVVSTTAPLRLTPVQPNDYFILPNNARRIKGRKYNFNTYRGTLEYRFSAKSSSTVVINELPLDWYIAGITETWNGAPYEYSKALLVAARSYAYFQLEHEKKRDSLFDVFASTNDQLYLGYDAELSMPKIAQAQRETYGEMVTYQGTPVITPYSSRTNGKTRTWKEAWGGQNKPWLVPVEAKYDKGKKRLGHGVGMSNHDAETRALKDGWDYKTILKHYYTGTEVEKIY